MPWLCAVLLAGGVSLGACTDDGDDPAQGPDAAPAQGPDAAPLQPGEVPSEAGALFSFLTAGGYVDFSSESAVHVSTGPHGRVRTFLNPALADSLAAQAVEHPAGAAAIKELYAQDGVTLRGWAVSVKTQDLSDGGQGWYWYEVFSTTDGTSPVADGDGEALCTGCHNNGGSDYILAPYPLQ